MIDIGALNDAIREALGEVGILIGDGQKPDDGGWEEGQPDVGRFVPYTVLLFEGAVPWSPFEVVGTDPFGWEVRWSYRHYGASRKQCDWQAVRARSALQEIRGLRSGVDDVFEVKGLQYPSLGGLVKVETVNPPFWQSFDQMLLNCSRVRTSSP